MLVARFSDNIQEDILRGWSAWMTPGLGGSKEDCKQDIEYGYADGEIIEFPEHKGCFGIKHHNGLSCYYLESECIEDAIDEIKILKLDGSGYGEKTVGNIKLVKTISKEDIKTIRDLHILEVEDCESEI